MKEGFTLGFVVEMILGFNSAHQYWAPNVNFINAVSMLQLIATLIEEREMRGVGGPLLCISDLLSDVGGENPGSHHDHAPPLDAAEDSKLPATELPKLFQENFDELKGALEGADHSWTGLTLKLCNALETANKLVDSTNSHVASLSEKVGTLEQIVKRRDSAITEAKGIQDSRRL